MVVFLQKNGVKFFFLVGCSIFIYLLVNLLLLRTTHLYKAKNLNIKRSWQEKAEIVTELKRNGLGEASSSFISLDEYQKNLYEQYGFNAVLSDLISVNRSVPDVRPDMCKNLTYSTDLPQVSIIITFYNERLSVLLRTVHSIINRSPLELVKEIILIDDGSTWDGLQRTLSDYVNSNFVRKNNLNVHILRLKGRRGLMIARMTGARAASDESKVFIFLDSHFEAIYNWLPPLLEPLAVNPKACTCPSIDRIAYDTFEYTRNNPWRGYFNWKLNFQMRPLEYEELEKPAENFYDYVMMGGAMAINVEFFWNLGGFDEGMELWGGEQYEMSFKIWMCGGELISVPCSRLGHVFRDPDTMGNTNLYGVNRSFESKNIRRLIDVWMDEEHRQYVIQHLPKIEHINPGDLSERYALRQQLNCKSFSWMLENKMPNLKKVYPPVEPKDFENGSIQSELQTQYCLNVDTQLKLTLEKCNLGNEQNFVYTWRCELRIHGSTCLESNIRRERVDTFLCHTTGGNQHWYYDREKKWIIQVENGYCMQVNIPNNRVELAKCKENDLSMKWLIGGIYLQLNNDCGA